ncbi:hypothetical protein M9H77_25198 [Catharanthus roseus]|uniref:Uncharacterized protein n=1 Tax=Catharanthus roseus TaxID=4058 RepID=A0ACC0A826_CATRO|nr:hypothetical protein M9H77_25198 [Catharanthus roseus]
MKANRYLIINRYMKLRTSDRRTYVTLACERGGALRKYTKPRVDDEEEEVPIKKWGSYGTKKCGCPFKLKGEQIATSENWQLFVHDGRHNNKMAVYNHGHTQAARLQRSMHRKYTVIAKIKKNRMKGRNKMEEILCLSAQRGYTVFYRNAKDINVLSDIFVAHETSIAMIRTWSYVLIMDTTYKTKKISLYHMQEPPVSAPHHVMSPSSHPMTCGNCWCQATTSQQISIIMRHWGGRTYMNANA